MSGTRIGVSFGSSREFFFCFVITLSLLFAAKPALAASPLAEPVLGE